MAEYGRADFMLRASVLLCPYPGTTSMYPGKFPMRSCKPTLRER